MHSLQSTLTYSDTNEFICLSSEIVDDDVVNSIIFENIELNTDENPSPSLAPVAVTNDTMSLANGTFICADTHSLTHSLTR